MANARSRTTWIGLVVAGLAAIAAALGLIGTLPGHAPQNPAPQQPAPPAPRHDGTDHAGDHAGTVEESALPPEARRVLDRIRRGGPFQGKDDTVFANREGLLPSAPRGTYREYTVPTPGVKDRGARRIVATRSPLRAWYTDDHYRSFVEIRLAQGR